MIKLLLLHPFNGLFSRTTWVSRYQKGKTSLDLNEARNNGAWDGSVISWTICKQPAPRCRQITTPTPNFYSPDAFPDAQPCQSTEGTGCHDTNVKNTYLLTDSLHFLNLSITISPSHRRTPCDNITTKHLQYLHVIQMFITLFIST